MTKVDQTVEKAADKLDRFVQQARANGGVKAKVAEALADDPEFLRKLKPSLIAARAKGNAPPPPAPSPAVEPAPPPAPDRPRSGPSPWLVLGAALVAGYALAKVIDWRSHAHPRW
jgi:hypothetical protein